jgi:integrase
LASLSQDPKSKNFRIHFRYGGKQFQKSLKTTDNVEAEAAEGRIELTLRELENGRMELPPDADFWEFVRSDGKRTQKAQVSTFQTIDQLFSRYEQEMPPGTMEANSLDTFRLHKKHLLRLLGARTTAKYITLSQTQEYVRRRAKERYRGRQISPRTIKKEVATFRAVWNWGKLHGIVTGDAPTRGLRNEKEDEKPPYLTWKQIEQRIKQGGLATDEVGRLWDTLFLRAAEIRACLEYVRSASRTAFVYPMFVFVAHTGARRSEMIRSRVEDFDFDAKAVTIREKKRDRRKKETQRRVDMTPLLERVMWDWLSAHPGGPHSFCHGGVVPQSRKRSETTGHQSCESRAKSYAERIAGVRERSDRPGPAPLTGSEANDHFKRALAGSRWAVVRGFHVFRHSFASNLAAAGERQERIDEMMGHQTEEMRRRYRHLFPEETRSALQKAFGD